MDRRDFFRTAGASVASARFAFGGHVADARPQVFAEKNRLDRIASCSWPIRYIFKTRSRAGAQPNPLTVELKQKYGEITMLDFPQFTKDTFPGVTHMDIFSGLFGDVSDDSMFDGGQFDPASASGRKWLEKLAAKAAATGTKVHHI